MKDRTNEAPATWYEKPAPDEPRGSFGDALGKRPSRDAAPAAPQPVAPVEQPDGRG